jgi:cholesterol transport system auxiliary component
MTALAHAVRPSGVSAVTLALVLSLQACTVNPPSPVKHSYLLEVNRAPSAEAPVHRGTLFVAVFRVAEPFAGKGMVYRFDEYRYESDFYNEFFVAPRDIVTQRVFQWLQSARLFDSTRPAAGGGRRGAVQLDGLVTEMYGDLRDAQQPRAVLAVQFYVTRDARPGNEVLFAQQLSQSVPIQDASPNSLAAGLSQALQAILAELEKQLRATPLGE